MFRTKAKKVPEGNYLLQAACKGRPSHTVFKDQFHPGGPYECPYCGADVA